MEMTKSISQTFLSWLIIGQVDFKKTMKQKYYFITALISFFLIAPALAFGAQFSAETVSQTMHAGDQFEVNIIADTEGSNINAFAGTVSFSNDVLTLSDVRDGNSIISLWVDEPKVATSGVSFSGIVPGGYTGKGFLFSLIFTAKKTGTTPIHFTDAEMLINDGKGTPVSVSASELPLTIAASSSASSTQIVAPLQDTEAPESFVPKVGSDPTLFNGQFFVAFSTTDKGSGVASYEVKEESQGIFSFAQWMSATSPYVLTDQKLHSDISVKATDRAGNIRVEKIAATYPLPWYEKYEDWFILIAVIVAGYFSLRKFLWKK